MSHTTFTRKTADFPAWRAVSYYWPHGSGLCHWLWWLPSGSFTRAKVALFIHGGGLGNAPGYGQMTDLDALSGKNLALARELSAQGYVVVSIDYPVTSYFRHQVLPDGLEGGARILGSWKEIFPLALWPEQATYMALAVQQIRSNASGVETDDDRGAFGEEILGEGNSIDPDEIYVIANDWAATCAMYAFLQPDGFYPYESQIGHLSMDPYSPRASHRVAGLILRNPGPIDFTQFHVVNRYNLPDTFPEYLCRDRFHPMMRAESERRWSAIQQSWKRQSPWHVLAENHVENCNLKLYVEFENNGYGEALYDANLSASDWSPGTTRTGTDTGQPTANGKAWVRPDDGRIQAAALRSALANYAALEWSGAPIQDSVVKDAVSGSDYPVITDSTAWVADVIATMGL